MLLVQHTEQIGTLKQDVAELKADAKEDREAHAIVATDLKVLTGKLRVSLVIVPLICGFATLVAVILSIVRK
jgi:hypothetical protein